MAYSYISSHLPGQKKGRKPYAQGISFQTGIKPAMKVVPLFFERRPLEPYNIRKWVSKISSGSSEAHPMLNSPRSSIKISLLNKNFHQIHCHCLVFKECGNAVHTDACIRKYLDESKLFSQQLHGHIPRYIMPGSLLVQGKWEGTLRQTTKQQQTIYPPPPYLNLSVHLNSILRRNDYAEQEEIIWQKEKGAIYHYQHGFCSGKYTGRKPANTSQKQITVCPAKTPVWKAKGSETENMA